MTNHKDQLTTSQTIVIISSYIVALGILTLPRNVTEETRTPDGWISMLIASVFLMLAGFIIVKLCQLFPQKTFYQYNQEIVGKWFGLLLSFGLIAYFLLLAGFEIRGMAEVTKVYLLPRTPLMATIVPFICLGIYLIKGGINPIARLLEILLPPTIIIFILVLLLSLKTFELNNLRPVLGSGIMPVIKGIKSTALSLTGIEIMLILFSFMKEPHKAVKASIIGISLPVFFYMVTIIFTVGGLGIEGVTIKTWPVLSLFRQFEFTGVLFERFETFMFAIWILQIFTTFVVCFYLAALGFAQLFHNKIDLFIFGLAPVMYLIALAPTNINDLFHFGTFLGYLGMFFIVVTPIVLLIIAVLRGKKHVPIA